VNVALFQSDVSNEIVIDQAVGGRTSVQDGRPTRAGRGVEAAWQGDLGTVSLRPQATPWLSAIFSTATRRMAFRRKVIVRVRTLPGVPTATGYGEIIWSPATVAGLSCRSRNPVCWQDVCDDPATKPIPGIRTRIANARIGLEQRVGAWVLREFNSAWNNLTDRTMRRRIIVGDTNTDFSSRAAARIT